MHDAGIFRFNNTEFHRKPTVTPVGEKLYAQNAGLQLFYSQAPMPGKFAKFTQNGSDAAIALGSQIDLSQISGLGLSGMLKAPGVLPGSPELLIQTKLLPDGDFYNFAGKGETDYVTYAYSGKVNKDSLIMAFDGVTLKNTRLANTAWTPAPLVKGNGRLPQPPGLQLSGAASRKRGEKRWL